jgi:hypothetical protein
VHNVEDPPSGGTPANTAVSVAESPVAVQPARVDTPVEQPEQPVVNGRRGQRYYRAQTVADALPPMEFANDFASGDVQGRKQRCSAVTLIVVGTPFGLAWRMGSVQHS